VIRLSHVFACLAILHTASARAQTTTCISVDSLGVPGNAVSATPSISADGRYVAYWSAASNIVPGSTGYTAIFVWDRLTGTTTMESVDSAGVGGDAQSYDPSLSPDGRYVAFWSWASNLVPGGTNGHAHVFVHDRQTGATTCVSVDSAGVQGNDESGYGQIPAISADGRFVVFTSFATNLVPGDTNGQPDVFVHDLQTGVTTRVNVSSSGEQGNGYGQWQSVAISADGRFVVFDDNASNFVSGDTNNEQDIFVHDMLTGTTTRVSVNSAGVAQDKTAWAPAISADGRYVAFSSDASNLGPGWNGGFQVFVHDRQTGVTTEVSVDSSNVGGDHGAFMPSISADGRFVAFASNSTNLVPNDTNAAMDIFLRDRETGATSRMSVDSAGVQGNAGSGFGYAYPTPPSMSADGRLVVFYSSATNFWPGDVNGAFDVFVRDRGAASSLTAYCFGDGSGAACPCSNNGQAGHGCGNSAVASGALLGASGEASLAASTVQLLSSGEPQMAMSIVFQGSATIAPVLYGDGLRCVGGNLLRLYVKTAVGGNMTAPEAGDPSIPMRSAQVGDPISLGGSRFYHVYYRDPNLLFCLPPAGGRFNVTNSIAIAWGA
jgi:Tol biopolymer transport system component